VFEYSKEQASDGEPIKKWIFASSGTEQRHFIGALVYISIQQCNNNFVVEHIQYLPIKCCALLQSAQ
jgi:hypothetical protein